MRVVETVRGDKVKREISCIMYEYVERDRREKVRGINWAIRREVINET